jgi:uncharacterized membrane protein YedE/YeeE
VIHMLTAAASGLLFGAGLAISGMMDPAKVIGFLDFAGDWDPTLAMVMAGALAVTVPIFRLSKGRPKAWSGDAIALPGRRDIDARLVGGAALFGIGWGLAGFCPGPAVAALSTGLPEVSAFVLAMLAGMGLYKVIFRA